MDGWMDRWREGQIGGWMDVWMDDKGGMNSFGIGMDDKAINTGMVGWKKIWTTG